MEQGLEYIIVGAGFYGAVLAEQIAENLGKHVLVIDKRNHIGGNSYTENDLETGIEKHVYGSHIFHTDKEAVWNYITQFTSFNNYRHKVLSTYKDSIYHIPINLLTINAFFKTRMNPKEAKEFIQQRAQEALIKDPNNFEEKAISLMGRELYEAFIKGYTLKQWQTDPRNLPASIINRIPAKFNYDMGYFTDPWQGIPVDGYTKVFQRILDHPRIEVQLGVDFEDIQNQLPATAFVIYSGPIDAFFHYKHGKLKYRSLRFEDKVVDVEDFQGTAVMNYAEAQVPYTRIHEYRHYHPELNYVKDKTCITYEYSLDTGTENEPYYPVNTPQDKKILSKYQAEAATLKNVLLGGRLGSYQYLDMDDAIELALNDFNTVILSRVKNM
ncbi:UDP-galactopyranose mutase [Desulfovibrio inopinatus]|uniref:UDP-galactopyranose mutase n=1 Tax=Desulfovibrio inopinatus TaxID=102109 RepID=UPI0003FD4ED2|nr:UDP-galactopyranose mutase [Desulfovibrio inopinatus]